MTAQAKGMVSLQITPEAFLRPFFSAGERICLRVFDDRKAGIFTGMKLETSLEELPGIVDGLRDHNAKMRGIFFVVNAGGHEDSDITRVNAQFVECDDASFEEQTARIEAFPVKPSIIVKTRKSLHTYWLMRDADLAAFRPIQKRLAAHFQGDKTCVNESRVLRLPGFDHCKREPIPVECVKFNPELRYTQAELAAALPELPAPDPTPTEPGTVHIAKASRPTRQGMALMEHGCLFMRHCRDHAATLGEHDWYAMITNLAVFEGGEARIHTLSAGYPGYQRNETREKIRHFLTSGTKPMTCQIIAEKGFVCPNLHTCPCKSPAALCYQPPDIDALRALLAEQPVAENAVERAQTAQQFVRGYLFAVDAVIAPTFLQYELRTHFGFNAADIKPLLALHKRLYNDRAKITKDVDGDADADAAVFERDGRYFRFKGDSVYPITNFIFKPLEMILSEDESQMTADLVSVRGETFRQTFLTTDFNNLQRFRGVINKRTIALSYTGSEADLELLKTYVSGLTWTVKHGVKALGVHPGEDGWLFVAGGQAMRAGGVAVEDVVQLEKYRGIDTSLHSYQPIDRDALLEIGAPLLSYNEPAKTVSVLAWCAGCFVKEHLRRTHIKYPHLFLIGEAGSGKSNTLERVILPIFARTRVVAATQVTAFTLMKESASSNIIPQALDEFKPSKMDRIRLHALYNHMRDTYDGHEGIRGRSDQSSIRYALLAPLIVAGEESPDEAAIRERSMELLFSKRDLKDPAARETFLHLSRMPDTLSALGRALLNVALGMDAKDVAAWHKDALGLFSKGLPSRIVNNLACCMVGLRLLEALCAKLGLVWNEVFPLKVKVCATYLQYAAKEFLLEGGETNKSVVEQTLEIIDRMGLDAEECKLLEGGKQVAIYFRGIYD